MNTALGLLCRRRNRVFRRLTCVVVTTCLLASTLAAPLSAGAAKPFAPAAAAAKNQKPNAILADGTIGYAGVPVTLDGSASSDPDGVIVSYDWDFNNDGIFDRTTTTATTQYAFLATGQVALRVTDNAGATSTDRARVDIIADASNPVAALEIAASAVVDTAVLLDAGASYDTNGIIVSYQWDFESDGITDATTTQPTITHAWTAVGTYTAKVTVTDAVGKTGVATDIIEITAPINLPPASVTGLAAEDVPADEGGAIALTWAVNREADFAHYHVYRATAPDGTFAQLPAEPVLPSYTDAGLADGAPYYYVVTAVDTAGNESAEPPAVSATAIDNLAPSIPSGLNVADVRIDSGDSLLASWSAGAEPDIAGYRLTIRDTVTAAVTTVDLSAADTTYEATGLVAGRTYEFAIAAYDEAGNASAASTPVAAAPSDELAPAVPAGLTAQDRPDDEGSVINVAWSPNAETDLAGYRVFRRVMPDGTPQLIADTTAAGYVDEACTDGVDYGYSVVAYDVWGNASAPSDTVVSRSFDWLPPLAVTSVMAVDAPSDQGGAVNVAWAPSSSPDVISYRVECLDAGGVTVGSFETAGLTHTFVGLANGAQYSFAVYASDLGGKESAASPLAVATPSDNLAPATPSDLAAADIAPDEGGSIAVGWSAGAEADLAGYVVYCYNAGGTLVERRETGFASSPVFAGLEVGATYGFAVSALDVNGNESALSAVVSGIGLDEVAPAPVVATAADVAGDQGGAIEVAWSASASADIAGYRILRDGGPIAEVTELSYTDTVVDTVAHAYAVVAVDAHGNASAPSAEVFAAAIDNIAPAPPSNLLVEDVPGDNGGAVYVAFDPSPDADVSGYCICWYTEDGTYVSERHVAALDTEVVIYDQPVASALYYQVEAFDASGQEGVPTLRLMALAADNTGPVAPTGVTAVDAPADEGGAIDLSWTPVDGATRYEVWRGNLLVMTTTNTSYRDAGLDNGVEYTYYIVAYDASELPSPPSEIVAATASDQLAPAVPLGFQALDRPDDIGTAIQLVWEIGTESDLAGYRVSRDGVQITQITDQSFLDTGVVAGQSYEYSLVAYDFSGNVSGAATAIATPIDNHPDAGPPTVPANVTAKVISYSTVVLSWADSTDDNAVTGYIVEKRRAGGAWTPAAEVTTGWWVDKMCASSTAYEYRVSAIDAHLFRSAASAPVAANTPVTANLISVYDNYYADMHYTGPWALLNTAPYSTSAYGGSVQSVDAAGASADCTFVGSHVTLIGLKGPNRGIADIYIDGMYEGSVDCYSPTMQWQLPLYSVQFGASGTHSLSVRYTGTKNPLSTGYAIDVDAVQYVRATGDLTAPGSPPGPTAVAARTNVVLTWTVPSGLPSSYPVWRRVPGGAWTYLGAPTTNRYTDLTVAEGTTYEYMVTSLDDHGNMSGTSAITRTTTPLRVENTDPAIVYVGSWNLLNTGGYATSASGGSVMMNSTKTEYAEYTFTGNKITWVALKGPDRGIADIYIDGGIMRSVDLYSAGYLWQQSLFTMTWATSGVHTIRVQCSYRKNLQSTGYAVDVDALEVTR